MFLSKRSLGYSTLIKIYLFLVKVGCLRWIQIYYVLKLAAIATIVVISIILTIELLIPALGIKNSKWCRYLVLNLIEVPRPVTIKTWTKIFEHM